MKAQEKKAFVISSSSLITKFVIINGKLFHESIWWTRDVEHRIFNSATGWKLAISFTFGQIFPPRAAPNIHIYYVFSLRIVEVSLRKVTHLEPLCIIISMSISRRCKLLRFHTVRQIYLKPWCFGGRLSTLLYRLSTLLYRLSTLLYRLSSSGFSCLAPLYPGQCRWSK